LSARLQKKTSIAYTGEAARRIITLRRAAQKMLMELESSHLEVVLIPSRDHDCAMRGGMIRAVQYQNPAWYRSFCGIKESRRKDILRWRKFKTAIKRRDTIRGLNELIRGGCSSLYARRLADFIEHQK
jgi:hypothetical protein